jgi:hypothetical protein
MIRIMTILLIIFIIKDIGAFEYNNNTITCSDIKLESNCNKYTEVCCNNNECCVWVYHDTTKIDECMSYTRVDAKDCILQKEQKEYILNKKPKDCDSNKGCFFIKTECVPESSYNSCMFAESFKFGVIIMGIIIICGIGCFILCGIFCNEDIEYKCLCKQKTIQEDNNRINEYPTDI